MLGLGRKDESAIADDESEEFEALVAEHLKELFGQKANELASLKATLSKIPENIDIYSEDGQEWKSNTVRMHKLGFEYTKAKRESYLHTFDAAKVFCMTIDGFVQYCSGKAGDSKFIEHLTFPVVEIDEFALAELHQIAPVSARASFLLALWDTGQRVEYTRQNTNLAAGSVLRQGDVYSWDRSIHGGTSTPAYTSIPKENIYILQYSWRLGVQVCKYLRSTTDVFNPKDSKYSVHSPEEPKHSQKFTDEELQRVPDTLLRFVIYHGEYFHCSDERGRMSSEAHPVSAGQILGPQGVRDQRPSSFRIAGSLCMFVNLVHEAVCIFRGLQDGALKLNKNSAPMSLELHPDVVCSMVYSNDVLVNFDPTILGVLGSTSIVQRYGLNTEVNFASHWKSGTLGGLFGESCVGDQVAHFPRSTEDVDFAGNYIDSRRRVISHSRGQKIDSRHSCAECFESESFPVDVAEA